MYQFLLHRKNNWGVKNPNFFFDTPLQVEILLPSQDVVTEIKLEHDFRWLETIGRKKKNQTSVSNGIGNNKPVRFKEMHGRTFKNI